MKTIQVTIDEPLLEQLDDAAHRLKLARSAFMREAVRRWLMSMQEAEWDRQHREAYQRMPLTPEEIEDFDSFQRLQDWDDLPWAPENT